MTDRAEEETIPEATATELLDAVNAGTVNFITLGADGKLTMREATAEDLFESFM